MCIYIYTYICSSMFNTPFDDFIPLYYTVKVPQKNGHRSCLRFWGAQRPEFAKAKALRSS